MKKLILASGSPRRKKILEEAGLEFDVIVSDYDEVLDSNEFSYKKIEQLAYNKGIDVYQKVKNQDGYISSLILSADTIVVIDEEILGKPADKAEAQKMLERLNGKKHYVVTSICAIDVTNFSHKTISCTSFVEFNNLSKEQIEEYVEKFNPVDKAGAYGIQELPDNFVKQIEGSFENIVGLCPTETKKLINGFK